MQTHSAHQDWRIACGAHSPGSTDQQRALPSCRGRSRAGGEEGSRGCDAWMASLTWWTWTWANSGRGWWTGRPGVLQSMGSQRIGHDWMTEEQHQLPSDGKPGSSYRNPGDRGGVGAPLSGLGCFSFWVPKLPLETSQSVFSPLNHVWISRNQVET